MKMAESIGAAVAAQLAFEIENRTYDDAMTIAADLVLQQRYLVERYCRDFDTDDAQD